MSLSEHNFNSKGIAALEFALVVPIVLILVLGVIDFGRLINARLIITNVSYEGGNLASRYRDIEIEHEAQNLLDLLVGSAKPLDIDNLGKIIISKIRAADFPDEQPTVAVQVERGGLNVESSIGNDKPNLGLSPELYNHLVFKEENGTSDILGVTVVEVFYKYNSITPLGNLIGGLFSEDRSLILKSRSCF